MITVTITAKNIRTDREDEDILLKERENWKEGYRICIEEQLENAGWKVESIHFCVTEEKK